MVIGPLPLPVSGFSVITEAFAIALGARLPVVIVDAAVRDDLAKPLYHGLRLARCLWACLRLLAWRLRGGRCLYVACNGGAGLAYTILLLLTARILPGPVWLHHHSFQYIHDESWLMRLLLRLACTDTIHIFLCDGMAARFQGRYGDIRAMVLSNAAFVAVPNMSTDRSLRAPYDGTLRLGLLSNLCREKGLYSFLDLLRAARREGLEIEAVLAGPAKGADRAAIEAALADAELSLVWLGGVYGAEKHAFYRDIDVFVFPTEYRTEAQPTVIFEAQAHGVPVIARGIGCIPSQLPGGMGLIPETADFIAHALEELRALCASDRLVRARSESYAFFATQRQEALADLDKMADAVKNA